MTKAQDMPDAGDPAGSQAFVATPPFRVGAGNMVYDANGDLVIVCSDEPDLGCDLYYSERLVAGDAHFICPRCGRLGQRMEEVTPGHAGLVPVP